jgi:hypothetical protein
MQGRSWSRQRLSILFAWLLLLATSLAPVAPANAANLSPIISGTPATSVQVGTQYAFQPNASDPEGARLRFYISNKPRWASFSSKTGKLTGTPLSAGRWSNIHIRVSDGRNTSTLPFFSIRATTASTNRAPVINGSPAAAVTAGQSYVFTPAASDADGNTLGFSIQNRPSWATFSTSTGRLSGAPTSAHVGTYANILISVSDGTVSVSLPAFSIAVTGLANTAPVISGTPPNSVNAGSAYSFRPTASDADGDTLTFSATNVPAWAVFNPSTGQLSGAPTSAHLGTYSSIVIRVTDGSATASLAPFSIAVVAVSNGSATLSWSAPTLNTDGSALTNLAGYRILYGTSASNLSQTIQLSNPGVTSYAIENLAPGTYYFAVRAFTSSAESQLSNTASKIIQ